VGSRNSRVRSSWPKDVAATLEEITRLLRIALVPVKLLLQIFLGVRGS
jgi:hypothetical protein